MTHDAAMNDLEPWERLVESAVGGNDMHHFEANYVLVAQPDFMKINV